MGSKRILIEVMGGDKDGLTLDSQSSNTTSKALAFHIYQKTDQGTEGKSFHGLSIGKMMSLVTDEVDIRNVNMEGNQTFIVQDKLEGGNEVLINLRDLGWDHQSKPKEE